MSKEEGEAVFPLRLMNGLESKRVEKPAAKGICVHERACETENK